jgi:[protein-PII] uridylyltransferase
MSYNGITLAEDLTRQTDEIIIRLFENHPSFQDWGLIALGGYGRKELCPFSDLDLLLLTQKATQSQTENLLRSIMYPLWDKKFNVSYSVRKIKEALNDARKDFFFSTSLLDARFLCGDYRFFKDLQKALIKDRVFRNKKKFFANITLHNKKRHAAFGDVSYIQEPDLKEGKGGLRDFHSMMWAAKIVCKANDLSELESAGIISHTDHKELLSALNFLLKVRALLHTISARKNDRIYLEYQDTIAHSLHIKEGVLTPSELFMRESHHNALILKSVSSAAITAMAHSLGIDKNKTNKRIDSHFELKSDQIIFSKNHEIDKDPDLILKAFAHMATLGKPLHPSARSLIRDNLSLVRIACSSTRDVFLQLLRAKEAQEALTAMIEMGVLERFIPEFKGIKGRTQFGVYHTLTIDLHSILTLHEMKSLEKEESETFSQIKDKELLYLTALLHDIGKGGKEKHSSHGADLAYKIVIRLGLSEDRAEFIRFIVKKHLALAQIALTRDLSEERVIIEFAQMLGDTQKLLHLYLLTIADSKATGPGAWTDWKAALIRELFRKTLNILQKGLLKEPGNATHLAKKWQELLHRVPDELGKKFAGRLWALPQIYVLLIDSADIITHLKLSVKIRSLSDIEIHVTQEGDHFILTIIAMDRPGLFATLTGIMAINHLDILSAKIFTWLDNTAVDVFEVMPAWKGFTEWNKIADQFNLISLDKLDIDGRVLVTKPLQGTQRTMIRKKHPSVIINNERSDFFTLIEISAPHRIGILFHIAKVINSFCLNIHRAFVSRDGDFCDNVFYVVDELGEKIEDESQKTQIIKAIHDILAP